MHGCRNGRRQFRIAGAADCQSGSGAGSAELHQPHTIAGNANYCLLQVQRRHCLKRLLLHLRNYQYQTDLRKGIDGLARMVQQQFELDPFTNTLFLFCGRRRDRIKGLYWEKDGFILLYKRLEQGAYQWPRSESEVRSLTPQQYRWLMEGLKIEQPKAHRPVTGLTVL